MKGKPLVEPLFKRIKRPKQLFGVLAVCCLFCVHVFFGGYMYQDNAAPGAATKDVRAESSRQEDYLTCDRYLEEFLGNRELPDVLLGQATMACGNKPMYDTTARIGWDGFKWEKAYQWEARTQRIFAHLITEETTYVGFGEWIGPTIIFAAKRAKKLYAMEPDPAAFDSLCKNVAANRKLGYDKKIEIQRRCVSTSKEHIRMSGIGGGGSALLVDDLDKHERIFQEKNLVHPSFDVPCNTLDSFLTEHSLLQTEKLFIKIDTEGAEKFIVPTLVPLVQKLKLDTLIFYISFHGRFTNMAEDPKVQHDVLQLAAQFRNAAFFPDRESQKGSFITGKEVTAEMITGSGDLVLTNLPFPTTFEECP
eukprot:CAMPEP_0194049546 /NCGR_PEP_ID=MMETSP0009_2-20130614/30745_1 /TAXON_ID=210454 /ORGANISM="Grammatophora oceanica, Strain CCMP 410" /LENGTH=362 /DNA_ID=CAMNT_0038695731 /DNA_START=36 /DNA_END=1124 /DNA_ORIENTATION=-